MSRPVTGSSLNNATARSTHIRVSLIHIRVSLESFRQTPYTRLITTRPARLLLFLAVSVCVFVCLSVCQHDNSWTVRDIIMKCSGHVHPMVVRADKFKMAIEVRGRWFNVGDVPVFHTSFHLFHFSPFLSSTTTSCCRSRLRTHLFYKSTHKADLPTPDCLHIISITGWTVVQALC